MLPSRGPIQVTLEDSSSQMRCQPPAQVKILRRPQPPYNTGAKQQQSASNDSLPGANFRQTIKKNANSQTTMQPESAAQQANRSNQEIRNCTFNNHKYNYDVSNDNFKQEDRLPTKQSSTINSSIASSGLTKTSYLHAASAALMTNPVSTSTSPSSLNSCPPQILSSQNYQKDNTSFCSSLQLPDDSNSNLTNRQHLSTSRPLDQTKKSVNISNKKSLKTYQERADDYAKARLRILGSAFPENDNSLTSNDDINRILNLDNNNPSSGSSSTIAMLNDQPSKLESTYNNNSNNSMLNGFENNQSVNNRYCRNEIRYYQDDA